MLILPLAAAAQRPQPAAPPASTTLRIDGVVERVGKDSLVVAAYDSTLALRITGETAFFWGNGPMEPDRLRPGDRVRVEARQADDGYFLALTVRLQALERPARPHARPTDEAEEAASPGRSLRLDTPLPERRAPRPRATGETEPRPRPEHEILLDRAGAEVQSFTATLPNFICKQLTTRYVSRKRPADWKLLDMLSVAVVYEGGKESYHALAVNGREVSMTMDGLPGSRTSGEFATMLHQIFLRGPEFRFQKESTASGRPALVYDYEIPSDSNWQLTAGTRKLYAPYRGSIWVDRQSARVLRLEMQSMALPRDFPLEAVESTLDYDFVRIGTEQFLLPVHTETLFCSRGLPNCTRNSTDFRNYRLFTSKSQITFDP